MCTVLLPPGVNPVAVKYRMSREERSIFWEVIVSVILSKNVYMNICPIPNGFQDRAIWMCNRKIVDKKEILRVRTVCNTGVNCSGDRVGTVYNKCSKSPPSTSVPFTTRVKKWIHETNCPLTYWMLSPAQRNVKTHSDEQHAMSSHELQSALMLTVEFSNICYKLYQLCHLNNKYRY